MNVYRYLIGYILCVCVYVYRCIDDDDVLMMAAPLDLLFKYDHMFCTLVPLTGGLPPSLTPLPLPFLRSDCGGSRLPPRSLPIRDPGERPRCLIRTACLPQSAAEEGGKDV